MEYVVILGITILIALVIAYAAGIESGKRCVAPPAMKEPDIVAIEILTSSEYEPAADLIEPGIEQITPAAMEMSENAEETEKKVAKSPEASYTIRLATFGKKENADSEMSALREEGYKAGLTKLGKWYQLYVYGFDDIESARSVKNKLIEKYPDCYIRKQS